MTGGEPRIVGNVDITGFHLKQWEPLQKVHHAIRHRIDMARCSRHRLGNHATVPIEDARGDVTTFSDDWTEGTANQCLSLFLHDCQ